MSEISEVRPCIEITDVSFAYAEQEEKSLTDISLTIYPGETIVFCGTSGCGKTSLIRLINGLTPFYYPGNLEGSVKVLGRETVAGTIYDMGVTVSTVFQNPRSQFFCVDVLSELAFGAENRRIPKDEILSRIDRTRAELELDPFMDRTMFKLSGGEKQKIACACVSVTDNPIVVLDEPSSNLDQDATRELKKMILRWKAEGKTVLIAEHRLEYLKDVADRFYVMKNGRIEDGYTAEEFRKFSQEELNRRGLRTLDYGELEIRNPAGTARGTLELSRVSFRYPREKALSLSIDELTLPKGGVVGIIGHNGAGKSTFIRNFCGLAGKGKGEYRWDGKKVSPRYRLSHSFLVMQDVNHQLFTQSVEEEIELSMGEESEEKLEAILKAFDLIPFRERHPMALSGGQKQRVAVASAVAGNRDVIVFDEPTSGLDYVHMMQVADCILSLTRQGKTVLLITHDLELIYAACSHILHLEQGQVKESYPLNGTTEEKLLEFFRKR